LAHALTNVWIGDHRLWAKEARFDMFAQYDVVNRGPICGARVVGKYVVTPVVITHKEGVKNVRVSKVKEEEIVREGENLMTVGTVEVKVGKKKKKKKLKKKIEGEAEGEVGKTEEVILGERPMVVVWRNGKEVDVGKKAWASKVKKCEEKDATQVSENMLLYNSKSEDKLWATGGMVAKVASGDSSLSIQQWVEDAGFMNIIVTPMGSDRVFLHCTGGEDIWKLFNEAIHFFGMLFSDLHKWTSEDEIYERDAWFRIYATPMHAWNEMFFNIYVSRCGRFIRSDDCTVNRARLDYA